MKGLLAVRRSKIPVQHVDGEYIIDWLVVGPFFPDDLDKDFLADAGGEANIQPEEGDTASTPDGQMLVWKRYTVKGNTGDLSDAFGDHEYATAYIFCALQSDTEGDAQFQLNFYGGVKAWINGESVCHFPERSFGGQNAFEANLKAGMNYCLIKTCNKDRDWKLAIRAKPLPPGRAVISGTISDEAGKFIEPAYIRLEQDGREIARTRADYSGYYQLIAYPVSGAYDLFARSSNRRNLSFQQLDIQLGEGERRELNFRLMKDINIEGTLLMLDDKTPHVAIPVQAIQDDKVIDTRFSDIDGKYQFLNLRPGTYQIRCQILQGYIYYGEEEVRKPEDRKARGPENERMSDQPIGLRVERGKTLKDIDFRFAPFKKGIWKTFTTIDGLAHNVVTDIHRDTDGVMWFATDGGGVSRYDGSKIANLTVKDGLVDNQVICIHTDPDGTMWFGTRHGVSHYDGKTFTNFTADDGLAGEYIGAIHRDPDGVMWFGSDSGLYRYDGKEFANFTREDGLAADRIWRPVYRDSNGKLWVATDGGGVSCYDGEVWTSLDTRDGLAGDTVSWVHQDSDGYFWFSTDKGITRYRQNTNPPGIQITSIEVPEQSYTDPESVPPIAVGNYVAIEYNAIDLKTVPQKRQYRHRIRELSQEWSKPTRASGTWDTNVGDGISIVNGVLRLDHIYKPGFTITLSTGENWEDYNFSADMRLAKTEPGATH